MTHRLAILLTCVLLRYVSCLNEEWWWSSLVSGYEGVHAAGADDAYIASDWGQSFNVQLQDVTAPWLVEMWPGLQRFGQHYHLCMQPVLTALAEAILRRDAQFLCMRQPSAFCYRRADRHTDRQTTINSASTNNDTYQRFRTVLDVCSNFAGGERSCCNLGRFVYLSVKARPNRAWPQLGSHQTALAIGMSLQCLL